MIIAGKRRPEIWIWPAGIRHASIVKTCSEPQQAVARLFGIPVCGQHFAACARFTAATRQPPIFHCRHAAGIDTLKSTMSSDHRFGQKLRAPLRDIGAWRAPVL